MYENETRPQRALLVSLDTGEYDAEVSWGSWRSWPTPPVRSLSSP